MQNQTRCRLAQPVNEFIRFNVMSGSELLHMPVELAWVVEKADPTAKLKELIQMSLDSMGRTRRNLANASV